MIYLIYRFIDYEENVIFVSDSLESCLSFLKKYKYSSDCFIIKYKINFLYNNGCFDYVEF